MTMRTIATLFAAVLATGACVAAEPLMYPETEDPSVNFINVEPVRSDCAVPTERTLLNGTWKFNYVEKPEERPVDFQAEAFDDSKWDDIVVPSNWQIQGYGTPLYTNAQHPFKVDAPRVTSEPPKDWVAARERFAVGYYRRTFDVPEEMLKSGQTFLRFDGVEPAFHLWINGRFVGYAEDSFSSDEFNVTKYLKPGKNTIAVRVPRWCDGSYAEDQDFFRHNGIFRDVVLFHTKDLTLRDMFMRGLLENDYKDGVLYGDVFVRNYGKEEASGKVEWTLTRDGKTILSGSQDVSVKPGEELPVKISGKIPSVAPWTAEIPNLYRFDVQMNGEKIGTEIGFRKVEIGPQFQLLVNGKEVLLKGVNRHDAHPDYGRAVPRSVIEQDLTMMKKNNINTLRTSHYPNDPYLYELCNKLGLYLVAEANLECHGWTKPLTDPAWEQTFVERNLNHFHRVKNNTAIIFWSLGNENGWHGDRDNLASASKAIRALDDTRLIHACEFFDLDYDAVDMGSTMYPDMKWLHDTGNNGKKKPFFVCEYAHAMGNAMGNFQEYMDEFEAHPRLIGGCIWDWVNQSIRAKEGPDGLAKAAPFTGDYFAYGGLFGDRPTQHDFCDNGVIFSDRRESAKLREVKKVYQYLRFRKIVEKNGEVEFSILNKYFHKTLEGAVAYAFVTGEGVDKALQTQSFELPAMKPGEDAKISVKIPESMDDRGILIMVFDGANVPAELIKERNLAAAERECIAFDFFQSPQTIPALPKADGKLDVQASGMNATIKGQDFSLEFKNGLPASFVYRGTKLLDGDDAFDFTIFRAPIANDKWMKERDKESIGGIRAVCKSFETEVKDGVFTANASYEAEGGKVKLSWKTEWTVYPDGTVRMNNKFPVFKANLVLPRLGFVFDLPADFRNVEYLGYGPHENYCDRKTSAWFDVFRDTVEGMIEPYTKTQSYGNRTGTRFVELFNKDGVGLRVESRDLNGFEFTASPWTEIEINDAGPRCRLPDANAKTILHIDAFQTGLGGASCGPRPLAKYIMPSPIPIHFDFTFRPFQK